MKLKHLSISLILALTAHLVAMPKAEKGTPEQIKRAKEERIKKGFVPPVEQCSYENEDYWIKIVNTCRDDIGDGLCPSVMILIDKKKDLDSDADTESVEILQGIVSGMWYPNGNSYVFYGDDDLKYRVTNYEPTELKIEQIIDGERNKTIYKKTLKSCDPNGKIP